MCPVVTQKLELMWMAKSRTLTNHWLDILLPVSPFETTVQQRWQLGGAGQLTILLWCPVLLWGSTLSFWPLWFVCVSSIFGLAAAIMSTQERHFFCTCLQHSQLFAATAEMSKIQWYIRRPKDILLLPPYQINTIPTLRTLINVNYINSWSSLTLYDFHQRLCRWKTISGLFESTLLLNRRFEFYIPVRLSEYHIREYQPSVPRDGACWHGYRTHSISQTETSLISITMNDADSRKYPELTLMNLNVKEADSVADGCCSAPMLEPLLRWRNGANLDVTFTLTNSNGSRIEWSRSISVSMFSEQGNADSAKRPSGGGRGGSGVRGSCGTTTTCTWFHNARFYYTRLPGLVATECEWSGVRTGTKRPLSENNLTTDLSEDFFFFWRSSCIV